MKDLIIDELIYEEDRPAHIARHTVAIDEVIEILIDEFAYVEKPSNRWVIIGRTAKNKYVTVILGERPKPNAYGLITAWPASRQERRFYTEQVAKQKGGEDDESHES